MTPSSKIVGKDLTFDIGDTVTLDVDHLVDKDATDVELSDIEIESVKNRLSRRFSDRETDKIVGILSLIGTKSAVDDIVEHPEKREEERKKAAEEKIFFADYLLLRFPS